jgi:NTP pyrophosphatase (non-canonical NTP hydrolase)
MSQQESQPTRPELAIEYEAFVKVLFQRSPMLDYSKDFAHAALGVVTEMYELRSATDGVNALEEAGDIMFYIEAMTQVAEDALGVRRDQFSSLITPEQAVSLQAQHRAVMNCVSDEAVDKELNDLLDHAKRWVGYGKQPDALVSVCVMASFLAGSEVATATIRHSTAPAFEEIIRANMRKLDKRYKDRVFTQDQAMNRDLQAEREALAD